LEAALCDDFLKSVTKTARQGLIKCQHTIGKLISFLPDISPSRIIEILLESGYREYLQERYSDAASREDDLEQLSHFSLRFYSLEDFLNELSLMTNMTETNNAQMYETNGNKVILSTIHQAKGLEWSVVLMIWCSDGMLPLARALKDPDGVEEERRLFYVATTRAKDQLYLCYPLISYSRGMGSTAQSPSRFIRELSPSSRYTKACPYDQWIVEEASKYD